jgi:hypothetical protein
MKRLKLLKKQNYSIGTYYNYSIGFWSKAFSNVEQRYSQVEKEALGVVLACKKFIVFLVGKKFL